MLGIREAMKEVDVETIVQRAREKLPGVKPRIISDNGPHFIARELKHFVRLCGMTHVRTSPYYPQSNGKIEILVLCSPAYKAKVHTNGARARDNCG